MYTVLIHGTKQKQHSFKWKDFTTLVYIQAWEDFTSHTDYKYRQGNVQVPRPLYRYHFETMAISEMWHWYINNLYTSLSTVFHNTKRSSEKHTSTDFTRQIHICSYSIPLSILWIYLFKGFTYTFHNVRL